MSNQDGSAPNDAFLNALNQKAEAYQIVKSEGYVTIKLIGALEINSAKTFEKDVLPTLFVAPFPSIIINCENLSAITKPWIRIILLIVQNSKKVNKDTRFILVNPEIQASFKAEGIDSVLKIAKNMRDALVQLGLVTTKALNVDFINPFLDATVNVLKIQASTIAKSGKFFVKKDTDKYLGDVSGVIGIVSESFNGSVVISFPEATFLKIISKMLGEECKEMTKEIADGAGELTNIIFGQAKIILNDKGYGIKTALPSVVSGKNHSVLALTKGPVVVIPFETESGPFFIEICLST